MISLDDVSGYLSGMIVKKHQYVKGKQNDDVSKTFHYFTFYPDISGYLWRYIWTPSTIVEGVLQLASYKKVLRSEVLSTQYSGLRNL